MTKDYAKQRLPRAAIRVRPKSKTKTSLLPTSIVLALCLGLGLGFGGSWFASHSPVPSENNSAPKHNVPTLKSRIHAKAEEVPPPQFDFYSLLPNMDAESMDAPAEQPHSQIAAVTEETSVSTSTSASASASKPISPTLQKTLTSAASTKFIIQAGAFKNQAAAEKLKAKLAFSGLQSKIESTPLQTGEKWYRVVIGPLESQAEAKNIQVQLQSTEKLNSLVLRVRV